MYVPLGPLSLNLPKSRDELLDMISSNTTWTEHPGLLAAKASLELGRSNQNAYILGIGAYHPESVGIFAKCVDNYSSIWECQVALDLPQMGILQTQIRVIWAYFDSGNDAQWVATLDQYLSRHEELKNSIPNAVIVYHDPLDDSTIAEKGSPFQIKLAAVNALRRRVLDEKYSNLVFAVYDHEKIRNPEKQILSFEAAINENWSFPKPTVVFPVYESYAAPKVNGYSKGSNGDYFFRNIYGALILVAEKCGDALGHAIFKKVFPAAETEWTFVRKHGVNLLPANNTLDFRVADLEEKMKSLQCQIAELSNQLNATIKENDDVRLQNQELEKQLNTAMWADSEQTKTEILDAIKVELDN